MHDICQLIDNYNCIKRGNHIYEAFTLELYAVTTEGWLGDLSLGYSSN